MHRKSFDFDLFSSEPITPKILPDVERVFGSQKVNPSINNQDELTIFVNEVKITFLH